MKVSTLLPMDGKSYTYELCDWGMQVTGYRAIKSEVATVINRHAEECLFCGLSLAHVKGRYYLQRRVCKKWAEITTPSDIYDQVSSDLSQIYTSIIQRYSMEIKEELFCKLV